MTDRLERGVFVADVKAVPESERVYRFVGTTAIRDRMGDEIPLSGWNFDNYLKNPVVLWAHRYDVPPIGRTLKISKERLKSGRYGWVFDVEFADPDANPFAEQIRKLVDRGFLRAVSVGFRSLKSEPLTETEEERERRIKEEPDTHLGRKFVKKELWELSLCPVPANPEALRKAIEANEIEVPAEIETYLRSYELNKMAEALQNTRRILEMAKQAKNQDPFLEEWIAKEEEKEEPEGQKEPEEKDPYEDVVIRGPIPVSVHPNPPKAPEDTPWDANAELRKATGNAKRLRYMHAWVNSSAEGFDPAERQWYKFPHHKGDGRQPVVWRGVANAMARLTRADVPRDDLPGIYRHLAFHYKQFDKEPPEFKEILDAWDAAQADGFKEAPEQKPGFEDSENWKEIRYRVRDPELFDPGTFRRITLKEDKPRIYAIIGRLKGRKTTTLQSLRFPKDDGWTIEKAKRWVKEHEDEIRMVEATSKFVAQLIEESPPERKDESPVRVPNRLVGPTDDDEVLVILDEDE